MAHEHPGRHTAERQLREGGYHRRKDGNIYGDADARADARMVTKGIHQHDRQMHGGKLTKLRLKSGGRVHGEEPECRPDRRARGGETGKKHGKVQINVNAAPQGDPQREAMARQQGMQQGAQIGARAVAARLAGAGGGGPPPGGVPMRAPMAGGPPMAPAGAGAPPMQRPVVPPGGGGPPVMARGGWLRDRHGRFAGGQV